VLVLMGAAPPNECEVGSFHLFGLRVAASGPTAGEAEVAALKRAERVAAACPAFIEDPVCDPSFSEMARLPWQFRRDLTMAAAGLASIPPLPTLAVRRRDAWVSLSRLEARRKALPSTESQAQLDPAERELRTALLEVEAGWRERTQAEALVSGAEMAWVGVARSWNAAECAWRECRAAQGKGAACAERDPAVVQAEEKLRALHRSLVEAEGQALLLLEPNLMAQRVGAEIPRLADTQRMALAATLIAELADTSVRPTVGRQRVAAFLAEVDSRPAWTPDQVAYARLLLAWGQRRERAVEAIDRDVIAIMGAWSRLGLADGGADIQTARVRTQAAIDRLRLHDPGPPPPRTL
jgi:hypothetical protein